MVRPSRLITTMSFAAVLSLSLAGCGGSGSGASTSAPPTPSATGTSAAPVAAVTNPVSQKLEELGTTFDDVRWDATVAIDALNTTCMAEAGFEYVPQLLPNAERPRFGTPEFVEEYGYGNSVPLWYTSDLPVPEDQLVAYNAALYGEGYDFESPPAGGCMAESWAAVWGDQVDSDLVDAVAEMYTTAESSGAGSAASAWSACMAEAGYEVGDLSDATALVEGQGVSVDEEIAVATADYTCRASTGVDTVQADVFKELEAAYYAANKQPVDALVVQLEKIVRG